jgi:DNA-binding XRE family transcriptional regulator
VRLYYTIRIRPQFVYWYSSIFQDYFSMAILSAIQVGAVLRQARQDAGLTQAALAALAGVPPGTLRDIEQGRVYPSYASLAGLCDALGLSMDVFRQPLVEVIGRPGPGRPGKQPAD